MSASHLPLSSLLPGTQTASRLVRDHVLPGDTHAGRDLSASADAWCCGESPLFVRLEIVDPETAHIAVLTFDDGGYGTLVSKTISPDQTLDRCCGGILGDARHVVLMAPEGTDPVALGLRTELLEFRVTERVRLVEREVFGLSRSHTDLDPEVWVGARNGDPIAAGYVACAARADLFALVCLGGSDVTVH